MEFFYLYWEVIFIGLILTVGVSLNLTAFKDINVRPIKDHLEEGWGGEEDKIHNKCQASSRRTCNLLMAFFIFLILFSSIFISFVAP